MSVDNMLQARDDHLYKLRLQRGKRLYQEANEANAQGDYCYVEFDEDGISFTFPVLNEDD